MRNITCHTILALGALSPLCLARTCETIIIPISATAQNRVLPESLTISSFTSELLSSIPNIPPTTVSAPVNISAVYCTPSPNPRSSTLQILVHGVTYTSSYWDGLDTGDGTYSWTSYANTQGYATLAIDRPCNGASTRLQSIAECQIPLNADVVHHLVQAARGGTLPLSTPRTFNSIIIVGHSLGSVISNFHGQIYPNDADAYVLTGFSPVLVNGLPAILGIGLTPASAGLHVGYVKIGFEAGQRFMFYHGQYSTSLQHADFLRGGTLALGEAATGLLGQLPVPAYTGAVFVLNGNEDTVFCQLLPVGSLLGMMGHCDAGPSQGVQALYPNARAFSLFDVQNTGHCLNMHHTAQQGYEKVHKFLEAQGL
ncbi:hypothetical protein EJ05DRAFT_476259 [Pseudovirgaria hyperparasitica]|uniref:AB hydrolase-1 domain-containing protein n=1 Tax=Pseudovirgaria hyperparasitica TaxID=470096 RepID=A0A6A6WA35_9PEZI|nr:uncharacterized protein EJ05DRAFT_476259 [Pseudovirgaria hyperparasitica]KAF2757971.1 hypothetical protein EJ05DRAFT_476259 [Pseudovirgaria hyperparasitica]